MDWLDVVVILVMVLPMYLGWRRGLIGTVVPLVGLIFAILVAGHFYDPVADWLSNWLDSSGQAKLLGFAIIFVAVIAAAFAVAVAARRFVNFLLIGWVDTIGGLVFGLLVPHFLLCGIESLLSVGGLLLKFRDLLLETFLSRFLVGPQVRRTRLLVFKSGVRFVQSFGLCLGLLFELPDAICELRLLAAHGLPGVGMS